MAGSVFPRLTPCAPSGSCQAKVQSQNSLLAVMVSAGRRSDAGEGEVEQRQAEADGLPLTGEGHLVPARDVQPAAHALPLGGGVEFKVSRSAVPELGVEAQDGAQGSEALGQEGAQAVLLRAVGYDELLNVHGDLLHLFFSS